MRCALTLSLLACSDPSGPSEGAPLDVEVECVRVRTACAHGEVTLFVRGARPEGEWTEVDGGWRSTFEASGDDLVVRREGRRWSLPLVTPAPTPVLDGIDSARTEANRDRLARALEDAGEERAAILSRLGRVHLALGEDQLAVERLLQARDAHSARSERTAAIHDAIAASWVLQTRRWELARAEEVLTSVDTLALDQPVAKARLAYHRALLANRLGQLRSAERLLDDAVLTASRFGVTDLLANASLKRASVLHREGRGAEARDALDRAARNLDEGCLRAHHTMQRAWLALLDDDTRLALRFLERARDEYLACGAPASDRDNVAVSLAMAHWRAGDLSAARAALPAETTSAELRAWSATIGAHLTLAEDPAEALARFDDVARRARLAPSPPAEWRAQLGRGRALEALGREDEAIDAFARAEDLLDTESRELPLRGSPVFVGARSESAARLAALLLRTGDTRRASHVLRRARRRALDRTARDRRARPTLASAARDYLRARQSLEADAAVVWDAPADELERLQERRQRRLDTIERALADAWGSGARALEDAPFDPPAPGILRLLVFPHPDGRIVMSEREGQLEGALVDERSWPTLDAAGLRRVEVLGAGPAAFAEPPTDLPTTYSLDLPRAEDPRTRRVVLADATGTLDGARAEAAALADSWDAELLGGELDEVVSALLDARHFHYAGHGSYDDQRGGVIALGDDVLFTAVDALALERAPEWVSLNGCSTAFGEGLVPVGIAQAFVLAGSRAAIGTLAPVRDDEARRFGEALAEAPLDVDAWARVTKDFPAFRLITN